MTMRFRTIHLGLEELSECSNEKKSEGTLQSKNAVMMEMGIDGDCTYLSNVSRSLM